MNKREPSCTVNGNGIGVITMKNSMEGPQKVKNGTALWSSDSTSGNISDETCSGNSKKYMHPYVHCTAFYNSQDMEATHAYQRMSRKRSVVHICNGIIVSHRKG